MNGVPYLVITELSSERLRIHAFGLSGIVRTTELPELFDDGLLSDFHGDDRSTSGNIVSHLVEDRIDSFVKFEKFTGHGLVQVEHLEGRDLKPSN